MDYGFFYDVAEYGNANWKGGFSPKEIAIHAYEYKCAWRNSLECHEVNRTIIELLRNLREDKNNLEYATTMDQLYTLRKVNEFIETIEESIKYWKLKCAA